MTQCATVFNHPIRPRISVEELSGKKVLTVFVPEVSASQKPIFFKDRALPRGAFRRIGSSDVCCSEDDVASFFQDRQRETYDESIVPDAKLSDISLSELNFYRELRRKEH